MSYKLVFQRENRDVKVIYWSASLEETQELARRIAVKWGADDFRIVGFSSDAEEKESMIPHAGATEFARSFGGSSSPDPSPLPEKIKNLSEQLPNSE